MAAVAALIAALVVAVPAPAGAAERPVDGESPASSAASCWEIKQVDGSSPSGVYWLQTPQMDSPIQAYCDMTTDGGGWVLIGRGQKWWNWSGEAQGTPAQVASTVTGTGAFSVRKLSGQDVDGLLGGTRVDALDDGVRLRRATNTAGSQWQEVRMRLRERDRWSWGLGAGHPLRSSLFDGQTYNGQTTRDFGTTSTSGQNAYRRVLTSESSQSGWRRGFHFGPGVGGSTSSSSYVYGSSSYATPFTQVFIRPRIRSTDLDYEQIPAGGTPEITQAPLAQSGSIPQQWGVEGSGRGTGEQAAEVQKFAQIGNRMFVAGNFTHVRNSDGSQRVEQSYLAAFDVSTGAWISSFRPTIDHQVRSLAAMPNGKLAIGGEFSQVNGQDRRGIAMLDPTSGALDTSWTTQVENRGRSGDVSVRHLEARDGMLYVGGLFTHVVKGSQAWFQRNLGRVDISAQVGGWNWNPNLHGSVLDFDVSDDGGRVYAAGYMTQSAQTPVGRGAALSTAAGAAVIPWSPTYSSRGADYQQAVEQVGNKVWLGGSQHSMFSYDTSSLALVDAHITRSGGDLQAIEKSGGIVYGGCHCGDWNYGGTTDYDTLSIGSTSIAWDQADKISLVGAWDSASGEYLDEFAPFWSSRGGRGVWALTTDSNGVLWAGGYLTKSLSETGAEQFSGGFARFAPRPSTAPAKPSGLSVTTVGDTARVSWTASSTQGATYEVLRGDRVVAVASGTSVTVPHAAAGDRYVVRATDGQGNYSASTSAVTPVVRQEVVGAGQDWAYVFDRDTEVAAAWKEQGFDDGAWATGTAPLGFGDDSIVTDIDASSPADRSLTAYFRRGFTLDEAPAGTYTLRTRADDGIAVYVNGVEVGRQNLPAGTLTAGTYATKAVATSAAIASPVTFSIPASALVQGENVVTAEVHTNYRSAKNLSFDATISASG